MSHVCRTCSRVNPADALFCYFDGVALDSHHRGGPVAVGAKPFPTPFVFPSGRQCRNFNELVRLADLQWEEAQDLLRQGYFESFLGGLGRSDLALAARQAAKEADRERSLDGFLNKLPVSDRDGPKLVVQPLEINLGEVTGERRFVVRIKNEGGGLLAGSVTGDDTKWLAFGDAPGKPQKIFQCRHDVEMAVHVVGKHLRAGNKPVEGRILVETNGGVALVVVRGEKPVQAFPEGVLVGAKLPREIAAKAKAHPKEAARLFESGAVEKWYETNGWSYPVQGPSSSGLGAIQQFFEALGLVQAPKVTLIQERLRFQGRAGAFLEQLLQVQTVEKRPVYAHATTSAPWLQLGRPMLEGRTASIPVRVPTVPATPGERLRGTIQVTSNGNQRFTVEVELNVTGPAIGRHVAATAPVIDLAETDADPTMIAVGSAALPLELEGGREFTSSRPAAVEPVATPVLDSLQVVDVAAPVASISAAPPILAPRPDTYSPPQAVSLMPFIAPIVPLLLLAASLFVVLGHDLLVPGRPPPPPQQTDKSPLIGLRFHDGPKPDRQGKERMPDPTMRFGLLIRRTDTPTGLTGDEIKSLNGREPADLNQFKRLTFDDWGRTNNTCVWIDDKEILFGDPAGRWVGRDEPLGDRKQGTRSTWRLDNDRVEVTQTVEVVAGEQSGRFDTCLVRYTIRNRDTRPHKVGIRFLLDTYIGENDGVPFTIPGDPNLCDTKKDLPSEAKDGKLPDYIEALEKDDLRNPGTVAHIGFRVGNKVESPTRVLLGHWPSPYLRKVDPAKFSDAQGENTLWNVPLASMQTLYKSDLRLRPEDGGGRPPKDSAVVLYWAPESLPADGTRDVGFTYGLGNVSSGEGGGHLLLTVGGRLVRDADFTLTALVANPKPDEELTLSLPQGLKLVGSGQTQKVPTGGVRDTGTVTWKVRAVQDGEHTLKVESNKGASQSQSVTIRSTGVFD
jgi:hypothetical protein